MSFSATSKDVELEGTILTAKCKIGGSEDYNSSSVDLNGILGTRDGRFNWDDTGFADSTEEGSIMLKGSILSANLLDNEGGYEEDQINLDFFIANINGNLEFKKPGSHIQESCAMFSIDANGVLSGLCLASDGKLHISSIDLNDHVGNKGGKFNTGTDHFAHSASNIRVEGFLLKADLLNYDREPTPAALDLTKYLSNNNGKLNYETHDGFFEADGFLFGFLEALPVVGWIVAGIRFIEGDNDRGFRALGESTYYSMVIGAGFLGLCFGGPVGAAIGAAFITPAALTVKRLIKENIVDPNMREEIATLTIWTFLIETFINAVGVGIGGYVGQYIGELVASRLAAQGVEGLIASLEKAGAKAGANFVTRDAIWELLRKISDAISNDSSIEEVKGRF